MNVSKSKKPILYAIIAAVLCLSVLQVASLIIERLELGYFAGNCLAEFVFLLAVIIAAIALKKIHTLRPTRVGLKAGLVCSLFLLIKSVVSSFLSYSLIIEDAPVMTATGLDILLLVIFTLFVGMAEELLFRGTVLECMNDVFSEGSVKDVHKAITFTGLLFGFFHLFNAISGVPFLSALVQAIFASAGGILFGAIYYRSRKNLWVCILAHMFLDLLSLLGGGILYGTTIGDQIASYSPINMVPSVIDLAVAAWLIRPKKIRPLLQVEATPESGAEAEA